MIKLRDYQQNIISDCRNALRQGYKHPLVCAPCGSGKTCIFVFMAEQAQSRGLKVVIIVNRQELFQQTIDTFARYKIELKTIRVVMAITYANHIKEETEPDLIITDEAHLSVAKTWIKIYEAFPNANVFGFSASPCRLDGSPLGKVYDKLITGISTKELIQQGYLADYEYYAPTVASLAGLKSRGGDYDAKEATELLSTKAVFGDVIKHYKKYADGLQTICYCSSIKHSEAMAEEFRTAGINAVHFDGNTPKEQRKQIVQDFRDKKIQILCNVDLISVGFDVPDCWCCILLRPTKSTALFIQQSCRALRPQEGKTAIILDHVNNYKRHGLPDMDRAWSLDAKVKPKRKHEESEINIRQCPKCFFTHEYALACPHCGYVYPIKERTLDEIKTAHLEQIKGIVLDYTTPNECQTLQELQAYAKNHNFKPGWAWYQAKRRKII